MNPTDDLEQIAYHRDRVAARRRAAADGMPLAAALQVELEAAADAAGLTLAQLAGERRAAAARELQRDADRQAARAAVRERKAAAWRAPQEAWQGWFDGSTRPNPGRMGIGALLRSPAGQEWEISRAVGHGDSSEAECLALIALLETAQAQGASPLVIHGDSQVVLQAVEGGSPVPAIASLCGRARELLSGMDDVSLRWVPRHRNQAADALSQRGLDDTA